MIVNEFDRAAIRRTVHKFIWCNENPEVKEKNTFIGGRTSLRILFHSIRFRIDDSKCVVVQLRVVMQRRPSLKVINYRNEGRPIIYLDETWLNAHHHLNKCRTDSDGTAIEVAKVIN